MVSKTVTCWGPILVRPRLIDEIDTPSQEKKNTKTKATQRSNQFMVTRFNGLNKRQEFWRKKIWPWVISLDPPVYFRFLGSSPRIRFNNRVGTNKHQTFERIKTLKPKMCTLQNSIKWHSIQISPPAFYSEGTNRILGQSWTVPQINPRHTIASAE